MFSDLIRAIASVAVAAAVNGKVRCDGVDLSCDGPGAVPLDELDLGGEAPREVVLLGPDTVRIKRGKALKISVEGDEAARDALRFKLDDGKLSILRDRLGSGTARGLATVTVVLPDPRKLTMAGSGRIEAEALGGEEAKIAIAGSGKVAVAKIDAGKLKIDVAGSGDVTASGKAQALRINIAGSGDAQLGALRTEEARVSIAGSGNCHFASDGEVRADIMGSGDVRVTGRARCTVKAMGSGRLVCEPPETDRKAA